MALPRDIKYISSLCILVSKDGGPFYDIDRGAYIIPVNYGGNCLKFERELLALVKKYLHYDRDDIPVV